MNIGELTATLGVNTAGLDEAQRRMKQFGSSVDDQTRSINQRMKVIGSSMKQTGKQMSMYVTGPLSIMGGVSTKTFADFEAGMNQVSAVSGETGEKLQEMEGVARELGATTKFTATEAAEGMNFLSMAGFEANETIQALPSTLDLAAAGNMELGRSADIVSNIMQGFGIEASNTAGTVDVLTATFTQSNTNLNQLGDAMSYVAPVARGFGQSVEETSAAVGILSDAGIQASKAGTGLRRILSVLSKKSDELGISVFNAEGNMRPLADIIAQLEEKGLSASEAMELFGQRGGPVIQTLLARGSEELRNFTSDLENSGGTAKRVAETQMEGLKGAFTELKSAATEAMISAIEPFANMLEGLVDRVKNAVQWYGNLDASTQKIIGVTAALVAAAGPLLTVLGYMMTNVLPGLVTAAAAASKAFYALRAAMLANPWTAIATGVAAIVTTMISLSKNSADASVNMKKINDAANEATKSLQEEQAQLQVLQDELKSASDRVNQHKEAVDGASRGTEDYRAKVTALKNAQSRRRDVIRQLNDKYGKYLNNELKMSDTYEDMEGKLKEVNAQLQRKIELQAAEARAEAAREQAVEALNRKRDLEERLKNLTRENVAEEANWFEKSKSIYFGLADLSFATKEKQLQYVRDRVEEEIAAEEEKYGKYVDLAGSYMRELDSMQRSFNWLDVMDVGGTERALFEAAKQVEETMSDVSFKPDMDIDTDGDADKNLSTYEKLQESLSKIADAEDHLGDVYDWNEERLSAYKNALDSYIESGNVSSQRAREVARAVRELEESLQDSNQDISESERLMRKYSEQIDTINAKNQVWGASYDSLAAQIKATEQAINRMLESGVDPADEKIKELRDTLNDLQGVQAGLPFQGMAQDMRDLFVATQNVTDTIKGLKSEQDSTSESTRELSQVVEQQLNNMFVSLGETIGEVIIGLSNSNDIFRTIAKAFGGFLKEMGAAIISYGVAMEAFRNAITNPIAAIVAGTALVAAGTVVQSLAKQAGERAQPAEMAGGGVVPDGYPNDSYPAMLSSGEHVVPPKDLPSFSERKGGYIAETSIDMRELRIKLKESEDNSNRFE